MATPAHTLNLCGVLSESKRIINAHSRHFLALSVLFLLPLSFSLVIFPTLHHSLLRSDVVTSQVFIFLHPQPPNPNQQLHQKALIFALVYAAFVYLLSFCALATITYSTFHGFYGRPVKFFPAIKSLVFSFFPLVATAIAAQFFICLIAFAFFLFAGAIINLGQSLGFVIDYNSNHFLGFCSVVGLAIMLVAIYFQVNWSLAPVIVVAESKWGIEPLRRSSYLVKGMRSVSLSLLLFFGLVTGFWVWFYPNTVMDFSTVDGWRSWAFVLQTVSVSTLLTLNLLQNIAATTVLYMYCKALHGELAIEIAEEFAREYVSLPFDDEKVPHVVTVVPA